MRGGSFAGQDTIHGLAQYVTGVVDIDSSVTLFLASFIAGIAILWHETYVPKTWHLWLIYVALLVMFTALVIGGNKVLALITEFSRKSKHSLDTMP